MQIKKYLDEITVTSNIDSTVAKPISKINKKKKKLKKKKLKKKKLKKKDGTGSIIDVTI